MYQRRSEEYWEGYNAYLSGARRSDNPYTNPRWEQDWEDGWDDAAYDD